jgi:hypothetical protein
VAVNEPGKVPPYDRFVAKLLERLVAAAKSGDKAQEEEASRRVLLGVALIVERITEELLEQLPIAIKAVEQARLDAARQAVIDQLQSSGDVTKRLEAIVEEAWERIQREESGEEPAT